MRRLFRILTSAATVLSLVLCVATMAACVRSYRASDEVWSRPTPRLLLRIDTHYGGFATAFITSKIARDFRVPDRVAWEHAPRSYVQWGGEVYGVRSSSRFGFAFKHLENNSSATRQLACPYWFIMLLTAILPAARLAGGRRRRRARRLRMGAGLCQHCGYDCRATPERCPECGTAR